MKSKKILIFASKFIDMKKFILILIVLSCGFTASAQIRDFLRKADNFLSTRYYRAEYDTAYISRPLNGRWTLMSKIPVTWSSFDASGSHDASNSTFSTSLVSDVNPKASISVGYLGLSVGLSRSFKKFAGREENDWEFRISTYGNKFGIEFSAGIINSLGGTFTFNTEQDSVTIELPEKFVSQAIINLNFYYVFNKNKFSYPAAFSQSYIQKRSAGSVLGGGFFNINHISIGDSINETELLRLTNTAIGIGVGYGYNFVLPRNWLLHISAIPSLVLNGNSVLYSLYNDRDSSRSSYPEFFIVGRTAFIHSLGRWFTGVTVQMNYSNTNSDKITSNNTQWHATAFIGIRL